CFLPATTGGGVDRDNIERVRSATFPVARRGYDKREVDRFLTSLAEWLETGGADQSRNDVIRRELERVGEETGRILTEAHDLEARRDEVLGSLERLSTELAGTATEHAQKIAERAKDTAAKAREDEDGASPPSDEAPEPEDEAAEDEPAEDEQQTQTMPAAKGS